MKLARIAIIAAVLASTLGGCIVPVRPAPCHRECWWSHGQRVCERRCY